MILTEYLNRGKHHSTLALYGIEGLLAFDFKEGGYDADSFIAAVESRASTASKLHGGATARGLIARLWNSGNPHLLVPY